MKKVLFCVDSYFQLTGSVGLRLERYADWEADIVIYNTTPSAKKICKRLRKEKIFRNVYFADTLLARVGDRYSLIQKFPKYFVYLASMLWPETGCRNILRHRLDDLYDHLLFNGYGAIVECIFNACYRKNSRIRCYRIDDGLGTYLSEWVKEKWKIRNMLEELMHKACNFQHIENYIDGYYVAEPEMMAFNPRYPVIQMPKLSRENLEFASALKHIFPYQIQKQLEHKKIIFFGTWGGEVEIDLKLLKVLKEIVPARDMLIKVHPREDKRKYEDLGIDTMEQSEIPWEAVMLNQDFSNSIFITVQSSAVFTSRMYFRKNGTDIYAYQFVEGKNYQLPDSIAGWIDLYQQKYSKDCVIVPRTLKEFKEAVRNRI